MISDIDKDGSGKQSELLKWDINKEMVRVKTGLSWIV
jgi:hypothetical protein